MNEPASDPGPNGSQKWGIVTRAGFQIVPDVLFVKQTQLGIDQTDMLVLLNLNTFWWYRNAPPYVRTSKIASRMGVTARTVQRSLKKLEEKELIRREDFTDEKGDTFPAIFLDGLISKLEDLAKSDLALSARMEQGAIQRSAAEAIPL